MHNCNRASCMRNNCTRPFSGFFNPGGAPGSYNAAGTTAYVSVHTYVMVIVARVVVSYPDSIHNGERAGSFSSYFSRLGNHATNKIARTYKSVRHSFSASKRGNSLARRYSFSASKWGDSLARRHSFSGPRMHGEEGSKVSSC